MKRVLSYIRNHYSEIYKVFLFLVAVVLLFLAFPKQGKLKYDFHKGKPWMHEDIIAPFDFPIYKSETELEKEQEEALVDLLYYFRYEDELINAKREELIEEFEQTWSREYGNKRRFENERTENFSVCLNVYDYIIHSGILQAIPEINDKPSDYVIVTLRGNVATEKALKDIFTIHTADAYIKTELQHKKNIEQDLLIPIIENHIFHNLVYDAVATEKEKESILQKISLTHGMVQRGEKIISKGELVTNEKYSVLESFRIEHKAKLGSSANVYAIMAGQLMLLAISLIVLYFFLLFFKKEIFKENKNIVLILLLVTFMVTVASMVVRYRVEYLYLVPICLVPIIIRVFYDTRLALYVHLITLIITGFLVPNSFEFVFLQLIAGIITILSIVHLQKRSQFFITSLMIFLTYSLIYIGLMLIEEGSLQGIDYVNFALFAGSAVLTLFSYPVIYLFEKVFGIITDVTLMELSNTNTKLLRELALKAPGTFQHSMQVANLAEEAIYEIGGNALLVRAGAMYHDIGKLDMPMYFIENQVTGVNPHDELTYDESARIIISHIIKGIEKAKKHNLPEQIIDFIRTHHGTRKTGYFYALQKQNLPDDEIDESEFTYHGPVPFSKETAVLMMADSVEAASRSLKRPDEQAVSDIIDKVIKGQMEMDQFINSDITMKEITKIKKIFKKKLMNIYHIRIEYPN